MTAPDKSKPEGPEVAPPAMKPSRLSPEDQAKCAEWRAGFSKALVQNLNRNVVADRAAKDDPDRPEQTSP